MAEVILKTKQRIFKLHTIRIVFHSVRFLCSLNVDI